MRRDSLPWLVAPALLTTVALVQFWAVIAHDLSTWSGAGMGMFASIDNEQTRYVDLAVQIDGEWHNVPSSVLEGDRAFELQVLPARSHLRDEARHLLDLRYAVEDGRALPVGGEGRMPDAARVGVVGVELGGTDDRPVLRSETLRTVTVER